MQEVKNLYESFRNNKISLKEFQFQLEPMLGDYEIITRVDENFIKRIINEIEIVIFTIPESMQKEKINKIYPEIMTYLNTKID